MLILTRRVGETFVIGDNISITVVGKKGNHIQIGIKAPKTVPILREELSKQLSSQNKKTNQEEKV